MRLAGRNVVITGGNGGIGLAAAKLLVAEGARVAVLGRNEDALRHAAEALGPGAIALRADVTDYAATERAFGEIAARLGKLDGVFVNAGTVSPTPLGRAKPEVFEQVVRTNFTAAFFTAQAALPHLNDGAALVFNGSVIASLGTPGMSAYAGAKGAIRAMVRSLASELAPRGIRVNQVTPGATRTSIWDALAPTADAAAALTARLSAAAPLGRMADVDDVARTVLFLLSDDARHVTAAEIVVDGGTTGAPAGAPGSRAA